MTDLKTIGPSGAAIHLLLAHGAGAPATSPFMEDIATGIAGHGICVIRFEFGYMAMRRTGAKRRPPPKAELLVPEFHEAVRRIHSEMNEGHRLFIGGKSMGGRVASLVADDLFTRGMIAGLVCLGYPFHPPRDATRLRTAHLMALRCPALIVQGERDPFGSRHEVESYRLPATIRVHWVTDGDHDLASPRGGASARLKNLEEAVHAIAAFAKDMS